MGLSAPALKALALRSSRPFQQFGQSGDVYTVNGATGCTHTVLQYLALLWLKRWYTHDQISILVGYPNQSKLYYRRGLRPAEVKAFCVKVGLPYTVALGLPLATVYAKANMGPVGIGYSYSYTPEWKNYIYHNVKADGKPNGFAEPEGTAGKTQLTGIQPNTGRAPSSSNPDGHFGCLLGAGIGSTGFQAYFWEPNHNSAARPEDPDYDIYTGTQFTRLYGSYSAVLSRTPYALVPTRTLGG